MKTEQFSNLIQLATGRTFQIATEDQELINEKDYFVYRTLPITGKTISFKWTTPKTNEKYLRSFITTFTTKYREPNPAAYTTRAPYFSPSWNEMEPIKQEYAYRNTPHQVPAYKPTAQKPTILATFKV